ncbi:MAG: carboxypeptidase regulatory-like domain-containing protein [Acidobacteria bacterium]|nr:carboxypeptidase regulatory-like domain-containing protein [Acidobacteriota bacterium]
MRSVLHEVRALGALVVLLLAGGGLPAAATADSLDPAAPPAASSAPAPPDTVESGGSAAGTGVYRGVVTDRRSGKAVSGASVVFTNEETGEAYQAATGDAGQYEVRLPAGEYVVDIKVGRKTYRSTGTFREEAAGKRWTMDFTIGTKLTEKDLKITTTPRDIRVIQAEPRPPLEGSKKWLEFFIFIGGLAAVGALAN